MRNSAFASAVLASESHSFAGANMETYLFEGCWAPRVGKTHVAELDLTADLFDCSKTTKDWLAAFGKHALHALKSAPCQLSLAIDSRQHTDGAGKKGSEQKKANQFSWRHVIAVD